jgi:hypothetical protein
MTDYATIQNIDWSTVNQAPYVGVETTKGTRVAATNALGLMTFSAPAPGARQQDFRAPGEKYTQSATYEDGPTEGSIEGALDYNGIELWAGVLSKPTTTNPATGVYQHVMGTSPRGRDDAASFSLEWGDPDIWAKSAAYAMLSEAGFSFDRDDSSFPLSGSWFSKEVYHDKIRYLDAVHGASAAGNLTLSFAMTATTEPIAHDASDADIKAALEALPNIDTVDVTALVVEFTGGLASTDVALLEVLRDTTDGTGVTVTETTAGGVGNEQQTIALGSPTEGAYRLSFTHTFTTGNIAYDASAADVKTAIIALFPFASADIETIGGALGTSPVQIFFTGEYKHRYTPAVTVDGTGLTDVTTSVARISQDTNLFTPKPIVPQDTNFYIAGTHTELSADDIEGMDRLFSGEFSLSDKRGPQSQIKRNRGAFTFDTEMAPSTELTMNVGTGQANVIRAAMRQQGHFFVRMEAISLEEVVTGSGYYYTMQLDMCLNVRSESASEDLDGVDGTTFTVGLFKDATWSKVLEVTMINGRASL